jgi:hypothetical protein
MPEPVSVPDRDGKIQCAHDLRLLIGGRPFFHVSHVLLLKAGDLPMLRQRSHMFYKNFTRVKI